MTRREFVVAGAAVPFALRSMAETTVTGGRWIFLGTDSGKGIYRAAWNGLTGELGKIELAVEADRPDFFAMRDQHDEFPTFYTVNSIGGGKGAVSSYRVEPLSGKLTLLNQISSHGDGPCYVSVDTWGDSAFVANYNGGSMAALRLTEDGRLRDVGGVFNCQKTLCGALGPVKSRQDASHLHCATISPANDFVLVCDLGEDAINVLAIDPDEDEVLGKAVRVVARPGSGPRHVAFHPNGKWVYCIHELDCTIDLYDWNAGMMKLRKGSVISTLAKGAGLKGNTGCEIVVGDDGRFVYACSRGVDEITVYRVGANGLLTEQQRLSCGGKVPRYIAFDPSRRWLVSCNQSAPGSVTVFAHDAKTGRLSESPKTFAAETPMFVAWV